MDKRRTIKSNVVPREVKEVPPGFEDDWLIKDNLKGKFNLFDLRSRISQIIASNNIPDSKEKKSTKGLNSSQYELKEHLQKFYDIGMLCQEMLNLSKIFRGKVFVRPANGWTIYGNEDGFHTVHRHNQQTIGHVAAVIYLSESRNSFHKSGKFFIFAGNRVNEHDPKEGDILMFPNHLYHGSYPQGPGIRQTLNLEFQLNYA